MTACRICNNSSNNKSYVAREMMFGYRDRFEYIKCAECGCLQIKEVPKDLSKYYPENYYSFKKKDYSGSGFINAFRKRQRAENWLYGRSVMGKLLSIRRRMPHYFDWFKKAGIGFNSEVLDIGCGTGDFLLEMRKYGFSNLTGIDVFIKEDIFYKNGVKILKKQLSELKRQFDFIVFNNSFEHMPQPLSVFKELHRLLRPGKYALIRTPVASSFAWRKYGVHWVQLDAPRHLFLHTSKSVQVLARQTGFSVAEAVFDSTEFQFLGSEQYANDIPLRDERSYCVDPRKSIFSEEEIMSFKGKAIELNRNKDGDSACFYLCNDGEQLK